MVSVAMHKQLASRLCMDTDGAGYVWTQTDGYHSGLYADTMNNLVQEQGESSHHV